MDVNSMKEQLCCVYKNDKWRTKVMNMQDNQVIAIWYSFRDRDMFNPETRKKKSAMLPLIEGEQLSFL